MRAVSLIAAVLLLGSAACLPGGQPVDAGLGMDGGGVLCSFDEECPAGWSCLSGLCSDKECESKATCPTGKVCIEGWCNDPPAQCASPEDCPGDWVCEGFTRTCIDPDPSGCQTAFDCQAEPGCENGCDCSATGQCLPRGVDAGPQDAARPDSSGHDTLVVVDAGPPPGLNVGGYRVEDWGVTDHHVAVLPADTWLLPGKTLIIARDAEQTEFEAAWGVTLDSNAVYLTTHSFASGVPIVNGNEEWMLLSPLGSTIDGKTIRGGQNKSYQRISTESATFSSSWSELPEGDATPGTCALGSTGGRLLISEWADHDDWKYEFIELYWAP